MSYSPQPILILCSHGRNPPLHPPPNLKYDLRNIPNPPKALRDVSDGRSKRLREHLLSENKFVQRLEGVEQEIRTAMESKLAAYALQAEERPMPEERTPEDPIKAEADGTTKSGPGIDANEVEEEEDTFSPTEDEVILRVGCNCALGHHRSVAFVEELSRRSWPKEWQIHIEHRDLDKKRAGGARRNQKAKFRDKMREDWE